MNVDFDLLRATCLDDARELLAEARDVLGRVREAGASEADRDALVRVAHTLAGDASLLPDLEVNCELARALETHLKATGIEELGGESLSLVARVFAVLSELVAAADAAEDPQLDIRELLGQLAERGDRQHGELR